MGNRALLADRAGSGGGALAEVLPAARDVDAEGFRRAVPELPRAGERFMLQASSRDPVPAASKAVPGGPRAGGSGGIVVVPAAESVGVSAVKGSLLGHSYYGDNTSFPSDLRTLLRERGGAAQRPHPACRPRDGGAYWILTRPR